MAIVNDVKDVIWWFGQAGGTNTAPNLGQGQSTRSGHRASGGPVSAGGAYLVGERGPEMLVMGSSSGTIVPNGAGGGVTINLYATVADGPSLDRFANQIAQRLGYVTGR